MIKKEKENISQEFINKFNILCNSETKFNNFVDLVNYLLEDEVQMNNLEKKLKNLVENVKNFRSKNFNENEQSGKILKEISLIAQFSTYNGVEVKVANEGFDDILKEMVINLTLKLEFDIGLGPERCFPESGILKVRF